MSKSLNINAPQIVQTRNTLNAVPSGSTAEPDENVKFVPQTLTEAQQAQARQNIGAISATEVPAQVQADWNENDPSDPSYIQNKPTISATPLIGKYEPFFVQNINNSNETLEIVCFGNDAPIITVETSTDGNTWTTLGTTAPGESLTMTITPGSKVYLRANANAWGGGNRILGVSKVGGNIMSLFYGSDFTGNETTYKAADAANSLFCATSGDNTTLLDASELLLPAVILTSNCHQNMFYRCINLVYGPKRIDAKVCGSNCNLQMFRRCYSLVIAPELPATTLAGYCYTSMFQECSMLTVAPVLPATTPAAYCYDSMFRDCTSLQKAPDLPLINVEDNHCYPSMFYGCAALTHAPAMAPQTRNGNDCSANMFANCTSLVVGPSMKFSIGIWGRSFANGFSGCTSLREIQIILGDGTQTIVVSDQQNMFANVAKYGVLYTVSWNDWTTNNIVPSTWRIVNLDESANTVPLTMTDANGNTIDGDFVAQNVTITPAV